MRAIIIHIAHVIEVEYSDARQSDCNATPEDLPGQRLRLQIIGAKRTEESEEKEDSQVTEPHITVTMLAEGVFDSTDDGE